MAEYLKDQFNGRLNGRGAQSVDIALCNLGDILISEGGQKNQFMRSCHHHHHIKREKKLQTKIRFDNKKHLGIEKQKPKEEEK